ncbi:MAG: bifunctional UDP-N-acetylmuramoyl-tripeptide:D-alanyl-D-alanine ligase/alanine racemase [Odoribacter sp.]|nr:bifunctional UDP-N-acetylmuramoyl-tripeptide:D-alanyl-D-alanine ligase/alanine racemase [Odoribacter sp.]
MSVLQKLNRISVKFSTSDIAGIVHGNLYGSPALYVIELLTDSRLFNFSEGVAFVAIRGVNRDGHIFINQLYKRGVRVFIVEVIPADFDDYQGSAFIEVQNATEALQYLAAYKRKQFTGTVIAVTGSAGKTIVKEWLADIMTLAMPVVRSPKSYNSQVGVPLSVWKLNPAYKAGIIEAGISLPGEMDKLQKVINPDIGVITNIGDAHQENFPDLKTKAAEKIKLFSDASSIVYCRDQKLIHKLISGNRSFKTKKLVGWSFKNKSAAVYIRKKTSSAGKTEVEIKFNGEEMQFMIPFADRASVENAISAASVCLTFGIDPEIIRTGLAGLVSVAMRMELKSGINGCQLIEDYYNSDPGSLGMAMEYLRSQNSRKTTLILSDFVQSGRDEKELYSEVATLINQTGIEKFIGVGKALHDNSVKFKEGSRFFYSTDEFVNNFNPADFRNETILLKGARVYEFEKISKLLEQQVHQTVLEINLDAVTHNLNEFRRHLSNTTRIMAMVKAFAYGAGSSEIAGLLEYHRVDYLAVAYADEGVELRKAGVSLPVMVMNPESSAFDLIIRYNLEPEIFSIPLLRIFANIASRHCLVDFPVHIKIDSGMHRLGFMPDETDELISLLKASERLKVISVFSHLAASEDPGFDSFTQMQVRVFMKAASIIQSALGYPVMRHILNSSGISRFPEYQFDMVRPGIGIYGIGKFGNFNLRSAGRFITRISQVKQIPAGEPVGYGCTDVSDQDRFIAILPVGYADGLNRKLGNRNGSLFIKNRRVPLIGNVCMDMCMADVTALQVKEGDEAEIFGENIRVEEIAEKCGTIPYEILTSIPARVKRVFYRE